MFRKVFITILILQFALIANAQSDCYYKLDKEKILANKNLDIFFKKLETDSFIIWNDKDKIPAYIMKQFNCISDNAKLANPSEKFEENDFVTDSTLPGRQLIFCAKSKNLFVLTYVHGGLAEHIHIVLMEFEKEKLVDVWCGVNIDELKDIKEIISFIKNNRDKEDGLNTNIIEL